MTVKVRKVGNSYTVTIPKALVDVLELRDGQELEAYALTKRSLAYTIISPIEKTIDWNKYRVPEADGLRDGKTPEEYVRSLRDDDRDENVF